MAAPERQFDHRKSFRRPVDPTRQMAELKVRHQRLPVQLFNESAGGFGGILDRDPGLAVGDTATLVTDGGRFEVRVAHIGESAATLPTGEVKMVFPIGLERLQGAAALPGGQAASDTRWTRRLRHALAPSGAVGVVAVALLAVAAIMGAISVALTLDAPFLQRLARWERGRDRPVLASDQTLPQVVTEVGLTESQQGQLHDIAAKTAWALQEIDARWQADPPEERARKQALLMEAAKREIMSKLTEGQRERWKTWIE